MADLHTHSTASDGVLSPRALVEAAARAGVKCLAITDHDSFAGSDSLRGQQTPIPVIPGVELSLRDMRGLHLLGYGLTEARELRSMVAELAQKRRSRARQMAEKLEQLGMPLDYPAIADACEGSVGRPHLARAMVEAGYVRDVETAFSRWLNEGKPAYVSGERLSMAEALPLLRRNGFVPVLAHPCELRKDDQTLNMLVESWRGRGLMGLEAYHPSARGKRFATLDHLARRMGLLVTGGSDFHADGDYHAPLGSMAQAWTSRESDLAALLGVMQRLREQNQ